MALTFKSTWAHGDTVAASQINAINTDIAALSQVITGRSYARLVKTGDFISYVVHSKRWAVRNDNGVIESLDGAHSVTLSDPGPNGQIAFYDLDSLSWMQYGLAYKVINIDYWIEVDNPF